MNKQQAERWGAEAMEIHEGNGEVEIHGVEVIRSRYVWLHCALAGRVV